MASQPLVWRTNAGGGGGPSRALRQAPPVRRAVALSYRSLYSWLPLPGWPGRSRASCVDREDIGGVDRLSGLQKKLLLGLESKLWVRAAHASGLVTEDAASHPAVHLELAWQTAGEQSTATTCIRIECSTHSNREG